ncbi:sodium:calcium antiporter [Halorussus salinisoli]|uniref:sodium:calcium antiporter n=1 Tax=Halorussus salinisoli TaxID=2558242 RepID=UPI0010C1B8C8|nr:sodium:calcium antiporter [Halorussus salinisoli]
MLRVAWYFLVAVVATGVIWKGSVLLEESAEKLAAYYGLPAIVQGAVVAAVGSSFPELSSTVLASLVHDDFELGVAAIIGSAVFNILVIPAASALAGTGVLQSDRDVVFKEAQFYMVSVATLLVTFSFAVIYYPLPDAGLSGSLTRPLALIPVALYGLYVFLQYLDTRDMREKRTVDASPLRLWGVLGASLVVIVAGVEGLVQAVLAFEEIFGIPSFFWGLTVLAVVTSLPDTFVSVKSAQKGEGVTSLANVLGSNVFDLLVALPAGVLVAGTMPVNFAVVVPMMGALTAATVLFFAVVRTDLELTDPEAYGLLVAYAVFVGWLLLETLGVTSLLA